MYVTTYIKQRITKEQIIYYLESNGASNIVIVNNQIRCTCPIHKGDNPTAFAYDLEQHLWICFTDACGGGDIFDLVRILTNSKDNFETLLKQTASIFGINIDGMKIDAKRELAARDNYKWMQYMTKKKHTNITYDINNIGELENIVSYRNFNYITLEHFGVRRSTLYNRIVIPLRDEKGITVGITMRRIDDTEQIKWIHRPKNINTGDILFNYPVEQIVHHPTAFIVEGCFDAMNLWQIGIRDALATLGSHLTDNQEKLLLKNYTRGVLAYDNDKAGIIATNKAIDRLKFKLELYVLDLGQFKDPGEITTREEFESLKILKWHEWRNKYGF